MFQYAVKPYIPYDIIPFDKPLPMLEWARQLQCAGGDISTVSTDGMMLSCPSWINEADIPFRPVEFTAEAEQALGDAIILRSLMKKKSKIDFIAADSVDSAKILIQQVRWRLHQELLTLCRPSILMNVVSVKH